MSSDKMFSMRGDYISEALHWELTQDDSEQDDEHGKEKREVLEAISDHGGDIELVLTGSIEQPVITNSHVAAARKLGLNPVNAHAASELEMLDGEKGWKELSTRVRNIQLVPTSNGDQREINWSPRNMSFHPSRAERDGFERDVHYSVFNLAMYNQFQEDDIVTGDVLVENVASHYDPHFTLESVEDARDWKEITENTVPENYRDGVNYVVDIAHTDYPEEMLEILGDDVEEVHVHNRTSGDHGQGEGEPSGDSHEYFDTHRPPLDGEIDVGSVMETIDDMAGDPDIVFEVKPEYLTPEVVDETYESHLV